MPIHAELLSSSSVHQAELLSLRSLKFSVRKSSRLVAAPLTDARVCASFLAAANRAGEGPYDLPFALTESQSPARVLAKEVEEDVSKAPK